MLTISTRIRQGGHSVLAHVTDFLPYFYVSVPRGFTPDDMELLKEYINNTLNLPGTVTDVSFAKKRSLWGYRGDTKPLFMKLTISDQRGLPKVRAMFEKGEVQFHDLFPEGVTTYESNIAYTLRFMIDCKVRLCCLKPVVFDSSLTGTPGCRDELD